GSKALTASVHRINVLMKIHQVLASKHSAHFCKERLDLQEDAEPLTVGVAEKVRTNRPVVDECRRHVPVGDHHSQMTAVLAEHSIGDVGHRLRIEFPKIPV